MTTPQFYSASFTGDIRLVPISCLSVSDAVLPATPSIKPHQLATCCRAVVDHVRSEHPQSLLMAAGWSLGANVLVSKTTFRQDALQSISALISSECCGSLFEQVRYLGEEGADTPLVAAVSMCNPFNLVRGPSD